MLCAAEAHSVPAAAAPLRTWHCSARLLLAVAAVNRVTVPWASLAQVTSSALATAWPCLLPSSLLAWRRLLCQKWLSLPRICRCQPVRASAKSWNQLATSSLTMSAALSAECAYSHRLLSFRCTSQKQHIEHGGDIPHLPGASGTAAGASERRLLSRRRPQDCSPPARACHAPGNGQSAVNDLPCSHRCPQKLVASTEGPAQQRLACHPMAGHTH